VTLTNAPVSPSTPGTQVTITGVATGCANAQYRFWELDPGSRWSMVQDYSASATYRWRSPSLAGSYRLEVDARNAGESVPYDVVANSTNMLKSANSCSTAALTPSPGPPSPAGVSVTLTGSSTGCAAPRYRFWVRDPGSRWSMVQDYGATATYRWTQTHHVGTYALEVDVRDATENTAYDVVAGLSFVVDGCASAALTASPPNTAARGTQVALSASASCPGTATYRFWVRPPGGAWQIARDYSLDNSFSWKPVAPGSYGLEVDVRDQGGADSYDAVANIPYGVT